MQLRESKPIMSFYEDSIDPAETIDSTTSRIGDREYQEFRAYKDNKIREAALAEGRAQASAERAAEEQAADAAALQSLTAKGLTLKDCFGTASTVRGRNEIINKHRSSFNTGSGVYRRLRRMAATAGLVQ